MEEETGGRASCDGPSLCLRALGTDLPSWFYLSVFLSIDSPDMQPLIVPNRQKKGGLLAKNSREVDIVS